MRKRERRKSVSLVTMGVRKEEQNAQYTRLMMNRSHAPIPSPPEIGIVMNKDDIMQDCIE